MSNVTTLSRIEDALEDFKAGKLLIVVDDQDRENEGDFVCAAEKMRLLEWPLVLSWMESGIEMSPRTTW